MSVPFVHFALSCHSEDGFLYGLWQVDVSRPCWNLLGLFAGVMLGMALAELFTRYSGHGVELNSMSSSVRLVPLRIPQVTCLDCYCRDFCGMNFGDASPTPTPLLILVGGVSILGCFFRFLQFYLF